ncbi:NADH(P)-binding-domain-containing protein [Hyaloscypha sp. PMI_1271]|nr:NADH(P)-binding-domain-containing protein [Hyaloscypha sp. PMI_1271]
MQILLLGATGRTGNLILASALSKNHAVTVLVREPSSLTSTPGLTIITGSPMAEQDVEQAIKAAPKLPDAVIIALASVRETDSPFSKPTSPPRLMTESHERVLEAMKKFGIKRLITISAFGVGDSNPNVCWPMRMMLNHSPMAFAFSDHNAWEEIPQGERLEWTLVRPCMLNDGELREAKVLGGQGKGAGLLASISRASVASFVLSRCLEGGEFLRETPVVCV